MCHKSILPPGLHDINEAELDNHFLSVFVGSTTRRLLIDNFRMYLSQIRQIAVNFEIWIDGSFVTEKPNPNDIDIVVFASSNELNVLSSQDQLRLRSLLDRNNVRQALGLDVLFAVAEDTNVRSYWRGWYGFDRNERPKGIARIVITL